MQVSQRGYRGMTQRKSMDREENVAAPRAVSQYRFADLALLVTALDQYNPHIVRRLLPERILQIVIDNGGAKGNHEPTIAATKSLMDTIDRLYGPKDFFRKEGEGSGESNSATALDSVLEMQFMTDLAWMIVNPGSGGQMLNYALDRYTPHSELMKRHIGFTARELCRAVRAIDWRIAGIMNFHLWLRAATLENPNQKVSGPPLETPPKPFLDAWRRAIVLSAGEMAEMSKWGPVPAVVSFLTGEPAAFSSRGESFSRWAFMPRGDGRVQLLSPSTLGETAVSAVHLALLASLREPELGEYGRKVGAVFEDLVESLLYRFYGDIKVERRQRFEGQRGDTDLLANVQGDSWLLIQCKGRILRPRGRWGRRDLYVADLDRNVLEAARQAKDALDATPPDRKIASTFLVLDAYFPGATMFTHTGGSVGRALRDLPLPVVLNYYDLDYLLRTLPRTDLIPYLHWREDILRSRRFMVFDEFDLLRLYLRRSEGFTDIVRLFGGNMMFMGHDPDIDRTTLHELDLRIFSDDPAVRVRLR